MPRIIYLLAATLMAISFSSSQAAKPVLTIYTSSSFISEWGPGPGVKKAFELQCDCVLKLVGLGSGVALLSRLRFEDVNTSADLILGIDSSLTAEAQATGLFEPHGLKGGNLVLPDEWTNDTFLPYDYGYFAFVYNREVLKKPPTSLKELVEDPNSPKILIQDPRTSTPGMGLLLWMKKVYGKGAYDAWEKLSARVVTVSRGWSEAYGLFLKGEAPMVLSYTTSPAYHVIAEQDDRYQAAHFSEGHYQQVEVAGLIGSSQQKALGREFLTFMHSPAFQNIIPTTNWMYPAALPASELPDAFNQLIDPSPALAFSDAEVARKRRLWVEEWLDAML